MINDNIPACKKCYDEEPKWQNDNFHYRSNSLCVRHTLAPTFIKLARGAGFTKKQAEFLNTI